MWASTTNADMKAGRNEGHAEHDQHGHPCPSATRPVRHHPHGGFDIFVAFSTANRNAADDDVVIDVEMLPNGWMDDLFEATVQATEESIINALVAGRTMKGINGNTVYGIPYDRLQDVLREYNRLDD